MVVGLGLEPMVELGLEPMVGLVTKYRARISSAPNAKRQGAYSAVSFPAPAPPTIPKEFACRGG